MQESFKILSEVRAATIVATDLSAMIAAWCDYLTYRQISESALSEEVAHAWGAPLAAGSRLIVLAPPLGGPVLRIIERPVEQGFSVMRTFGWNALEVLVEDPDAITSKLKGGPFRHLSGPANLQGMPAIRAVQFCDPAEIAVYLTRVGDEAAKGAGLPQARGPIDRIFVTILGTSQIEHTRAFYKQTFGLDSSPAAPTRISGLSRAHGLDPETQHRLSVAQSSPGHLIEIDEFPQGATTRVRAEFDLPPGLIALSFATAGPIDESSKYETPLGLESQKAVFMLGPDGEGIELLF